MKVEDAMNKGVISINADTPPTEAFQKMYKDGVRRLFVMDDAGDLWCSFLFRSHWSPWNH
jgi:predicted transcriptional regulator